MSDDQQAGDHQDTNGTPDGRNVSNLPDRHPKAVAERRRAAVAQARAAGASWEEAARNAGYASPQAAMKALRGWTRPMDPIDRDAVRNSTIIALDTVIRVGLEELTEHRSASHGTLVVRAAEVRARILGLHEPVRVEQTVVTVDAVAWLRSLMPAT